MHTFRSVPGPTAALRNDLTVGHGVVVGGGVLLAVEGGNGRHPWLENCTHPTDHDLHDLQ